MAVRHFNVGDYVMITNPYKKYLNRKNVIGKVAIITGYFEYYQIRSYPTYRVEFFIEPEGVKNGEYGTVYDEKEMKKINLEEKISLKKKV